MTPAELIYLRPGDRNGPRLERAGTMWRVAGRHANGSEWERFASELEVSLFQALNRARRRIKALEEKLKHE